MQFAFELGTSRQSARCYLFGAETSDNRLQWMMMLAKVQMTVYSSYIVPPVPHGMVDTTGRFC